MNIPSLKIALINRLGNLSLGEKVKLQSRKSLENIKQLAEEKLKNPKLSFRDEREARDTLAFLEETKRQLALGNVEFEQEAN